MTEHISPGNTQEGLPSNKHIPLVRRQQKPHYAFHPICCLPSVRLPKCRFRDADGINKQLGRCTRAMLHTSCEEATARHMCVSSLTFNSALRPLVATGSE